VCKKNKKFFLLIFICFSIYAPLLSAQNHTSVSLDNHIYYILEQAELRGLCSPLSGIKPYTRNTVISAINQILNSDNTGKLNNIEREILQKHLIQLTVSKQGMDWQKGLYHMETVIGENEAPLSLNIGGNLNMEGSAGLYPELDGYYFGTDVWIRFYLNGDIGNNISWEFAGEGGLIRAPKNLIGTYNTYYEGFDRDAESEYQNRLINIYSEPLTHFPYTYRKRWDGSIYFFSDLYHFNSWPEDFAGAYNLLSEMTASFLDDKLILRAGRLPREWSSTSVGSSLGLNTMARPFLGIETEFKPFSWFSIAAMTGSLEYFNTYLGENIPYGIKKSAMTFQNFFSISMIQLKFKYFSLDIGEAVIWPKRLEFGYGIPIVNSIFYQNNIGDFDNMSMIINLKAQYPGIGIIWASLFWDEAYWVLDFYELDRTILSLQFGMNIALPFLSFSSVKLSYTKINPYTYTHNRNFNPWYGDLRMETAYTNNGVSLGHYLPPNSDELLVRFETMPAGNITANLQYQMIRHGADFGSGAVDGSNLLSELDPDGREGSNSILKRFFLRDGAYQWMHIIRLGFEWTLRKAPVSFYAEAGTVISYFTNTVGFDANSGQAHSYSIIDTADYPKSTGFIIKLGIKIFPR